MSQCLKANDFLDRWPDIVSGYEALRGRYTQVYQNHHQRRQEEVEEREVTSVQEMAQLTTRMRAVAARALEAGKQVPARVEVEVK